MRVSLCVCVIPLGKGCVEACPFNSGADKDVFSHRAGSVGVNCGRVKFSLSLVLQSDF